MRPALVDKQPPGTLLLESDVPLGRKSRILLEYGDTLRPLIFFASRPDGSIVCGPPRSKGTMVRTAYRQGSDRPLPEKLQQSLGTSTVPADFHITFHKTGIVNTGDHARTYRPKLTADAMQHLCRFQFQHPATLPAVSQRRSDLVLPDWLGVQSASEGRLAIVPMGDAIVFSDVPEQVALVVHATARSGEVALQLQFSLFRTERAWPTETVITWASQDPRPDPI